jgi:hypothetical protein
LQQPVSGGGPDARGRPVIVPNSRQGCERGKRSAARCRSDLGQYNRPASTVPTIAGLKSAKQVAAWRKLGKIVGQGLLVGHLLTFLLIPA